MIEPLHQRYRERPPLPWKNGLGETREIAIDTATASGDAFNWRLSIATIADPSDFSFYPGVDRTFALLRGTGFALSINGHRRLLEATSNYVSFRGEDQVRAFPGRSPAIGFNVMTRRPSLAHAARSAGCTDEGLTIHSTAPLLCLVAVAGDLIAASNGATYALEPLDALLLRDPGKKTIDVKGRRSLQNASILITEIRLG